MVFMDDSLIGQVAFINGQVIAIDKDHNAAQEQVIAIWFTRGSNKHHQMYLQELCNQYLNKQDIYPTTLTDAYNVMVWCTSDWAQHIPTRDGLTFTTTGTTYDQNNTQATTSDDNYQCIIPGTNGQVYENIWCYGWNNYGHYQSHCPYGHRNNQQSRQQHLTVGFSFLQSVKQSHNPRN